MIRLIKCEINLKRKKTDTNCFYQLVFSTFYIGGGGEEEMLEFSFHVSLEEEPVK